MSGLSLSLQAEELLRLLVAQVIQPRIYTTDPTRGLSTMNQESTSTESAKPATTDGTNSTTSTTDQDQQETSTTGPKKSSESASRTTESQEPIPEQSLPPTDGGEPESPSVPSIDPGEPETPVLSDDEKKKIKRDKEYKEHKKHSTDVPDGLMIVQQQDSYYDPFSS